MEVKKVGAQGRVATKRKNIIIGILATKFFDQRHFGVQDDYFRHYLEHIKTLNGIGYIFSYVDVDWKQNKVRGYFLNDKDEWQQGRFPLPDVCYNRSFAPSSKVRSKDVVTLLLKKGVKVFNSPVGDKWSVYKKIAQRPETAHCLPDTERLTSGAQLHTMLNKYQEVYIKPSNGTKGQGIYKVSLKDGKYRLQSFSQPTPVIYTTLKALMVKFNLKKNMLLIQEGIRSPGNREHFDLRVMVQKDRYNHWHITGKAARLGQLGNITTNVHTGGQVKDLNKLLEERGFMPQEIAVINEEINFLSLRIAEILDSTSSALGELGLDFVIDKQGKVWFLEANRKPGRQSMEKMGEDALQLALLRPIEYAVYLAGNRKTEVIFQR